MRLHYTYRKYPYSERATICSIQLGLLTSRPMYLVYGLFWCLAAYALFSEALGLQDNLAMPLTLASLILMVPLIRWIRSVISRRIDRMAAREWVQRREEALRHAPRREE